MHPHIPQVPAFISPENIWNAPAPTLALYLLREGASDAALRHPFLALNCVQSKNAQEYSLRLPGRGHGVVKALSRHGRMVGD